MCWGTCFFGTYLQPVCHLNELRFICVKLCREQKTRSHDKVQDLLSVYLPRTKFSWSLSTRFIRAKKLAELNGLKIVKNGRLQSQWVRPGILLINANIFQVIKFSGNIGGKGAKCNQIMEI